MKTLSSILILLSASLLTVAQAVPTPTSSSPTPPQLRIVPQPDAPAKISSAEVTWATPDDRRGVQIYIVVENVTQQGIQTYTTRRELNEPAGRKACLGPPGRPGGVFRPLQKWGTSTWQGVPNADPPSAVWIDFVEFVDGTRWGADECRMGERIDGGRAGTRAQRDQLLEIFREKGADALMAFIKQNFKMGLEIGALSRGEKPLLPVAPPPGHSKEWDEGFSSGARALLQRVIDAEREWGADEIEHVLLRPISPAEKKSP